jgi:hypothetical protein
MGAGRGLTTPHPKKLAHYKILKKPDTWWAVFNMVTAFEIHKRWGIS